MKIVIWGKTEEAIKTYESLKKHYEIVGFGENNLGHAGDIICEHEVLSCYKVKELYQRNAAEAIVIPGTYGERTVKGIVRSLQQLEILTKDIYIQPFNAVKEKRNEIVRWEELIHLYSLNVKVAEHCNLNCRRCNNFSNIIRESFYDIIQFEKDIKRLSELVENISCIKLIGGEPLLNKDIDKFVIITRKYYPYAAINVVTNGTLVLQLDEKVMECFREHGVCIQMTLYPVMQVQIDNIIKWIKKYKVKCEIFRDGDGFGAFINLKGNNDKKLVEGREFYGKCVSMCKGQICRCGPGMTVNYFNEKFSVSLPDNGRIDLYGKNLTGSKLIDLLNQSIDLCGYCDACLPIEGRKMHRWERCITRDSELEDYLIY